MLVYPQELSSDFMGYLLFFGTPTYSRLQAGTGFSYISPSSETRERRKWPPLNTCITQMKLNQHGRSGLVRKAPHRVFAAPSYSPH